MKVLTYNILRGGQFEAGNRIGEILAFLKAEKADFICLNECDHFNSLISLFEKELNMRAVYHSTPSGTALVLLFKDIYILESVSAFDRFMFHGMLVADFKIEALSFRLIVTHLNPYSAELRLIESQIIAQMALRHENVLIAGDFNAVAPSFSPDFKLFKKTFNARSTFYDGSPDTRALSNLIRLGFFDLWSKFHTVADEINEGTYPTPLGGKNEQYPYSLRIDFILGSDFFKASCQNCQVLKSAKLDFISDHYPLKAEFKL